jgi:alpha-1,2-mannosyltransferase
MSLWRLTWPLSGRPSDVAAPDDTRGTHSLPTWLLGPGALVMAFSTVFLAIFEHRAGQPPSDLIVYLGGAHEFLHGRSVYDYSLNGYPYTYPPVTVAFFAPLSAVSLTSAHLLIVFVSVAAVGATAWFTFRMLGYRANLGLLGATLGIVGVAFWLTPVLASLEQGQVNIVLMLLVVADFALARHRKWPTGVLIGVATATKLVPGLFIVYLLLTRRYRAGITAAVTAAVFTAFGFAVAWSDSVRYWFGGLFNSPSRVAGPSGVDSPFNQSLNGVAIRLLGASTGHIAWYPLALVVVIVGLGIAVTWHRVGEQVGGILACAVTALLISPLSWNEHWVWIVPIVVWLLELGRRARHVVPIVAGLMPTLACVPFLYVILPSVSGGRPLIIDLLGVVDHRWEVRRDHGPLTWAAGTAYVSMGLLFLAGGALALRTLIATQQRMESTSALITARAGAAAGLHDLDERLSNAGTAPALRSGRHHRV